MGSRVIGAESIIIFNDKIILGMQKEKRWYKNENGSVSAIIKNIGGQIEEIDNKSSKNALIRELMEEISNISFENIEISDVIFNKKIRMKDLNPFDKSSTLEMQADFYLVNLKNISVLEPNDLPFLVEIPINEFVNFKMCSKTKINKIVKYVIKNKKYDVALPDYYAFFIPDDVIKYLKDNYDSSCI